MSIRCKMRINEIRYSMGSKPDPTGKKNARGYVENVPCRMATITASPTYSDNPNDENKKFWDASPGGKFEINCVNEKVVEALRLGEEYYFDISPVNPS